MSRMNHVKWVDKKNNMACVEAGIIGKDLERELLRYGVVCGHEPVKSSLFV
jgi:alkyldihydroxyacetonephosphate synthase